MIRTAKTDEPARIMVYGAAWCEDTTRIRRLLDQWGTPYRYFDIDQDCYLRAKVEHWNFGSLVIPAVTFGALETPRLFAPSDEDLHTLAYSFQPVRVGPLLL
jgi:glutaredoxin